LTLSGTFQHERRSSEYPQSFLADEIAKWETIIKASGVAMD
jgi:hypothetical protein